MALALSCASKRSSSKAMASGMGGGCALEGVARTAISRR